MKLKPSILTILILTIGIQTFAFEHIRCYTDQYLQLKKEDNPLFEKAFNQTYDYIYDLARHAREMEDSVIFRIPVIVHVVHNPNIPGQNIHDSLIYNQIEVLNQDFRRQNPDTSLTREIFKPYAGDAGIEFFLAEVDPDGNPTTGITRTETSEASFMDLSFNLDKVKSSAEGGIDAWPTDKYLNIWVCNLNIVFGGLELPGVLGFAYPPVGAPNWPADQFPDEPEYAGVVVHYQVFGRNNPDATGPLDVVSRGRTATHEIGHFLGLRHIWGDGNCNEDDGIIDTPLQGQASQQTCNYNQNTCTISPVNYPDMIENFLDYSDERCMNMFTHGQIAVMRMVLRELRPDLAITDDEEITSLIERQYSNSAIRVYPNPVREQLYVSFNTATKIDKIVISDVTGRVVNTRNYYGQSYHTLKIETSNLTSGIYFIESLSGESKFVNRFVVN